MRYLILFLFPSVCFAGDWTTSDTVRQSIYTGLVMTDWAQTRWALNHKDTTYQCIGHSCIPTVHGFEEMNPALGSNPSMGKLNNLVALSIVGNLAVSYALPPTWRHAWQYVWIGVEGGAIAHNHAIGIKVHF